MKKQTIVLSSLLLSLPLLLAANARAATFTFDAGTEAWAAVSMPDHGPYTAILGGPYAVNFEPAGGHPGGSISMTDPDGVTFFFSAPAGVLGNRSDAYGNSISFDIKIGYKGWTDTDVVLVGGGLALAVDAGPDPEVDIWTSYSVPVDDTGGWHAGTLNGPLASAADIMAVLANLEGLYIRGEFAFGSDYTYLDNVAFPSVPSVPEPATVILLGCGLIGLGLAGRRRNKFLSR